MIKNHRVKFLGLWLLHILKKRYLSVNFDPVLACNLRCKMCYFTDENYSKDLKGVFKKEDLPLWANRILPRALKLQVGCATEPTLYKHLDEVFVLAKSYKVPHISLTTNANLLEKESLEKWVQNGLNEIIVSLHGVHRESYAFFMDKGNYERFHQSLQTISDLKKEFPNLALRINYTFNKDNFSELIDFFNVFGTYQIDTIQLRPIKKLGETAYHHFDLASVSKSYADFIPVFKRECKNRKITLLAPDTLDHSNSRKNDSSLLVSYTYCYISPTDFWHTDFDWRNESYETYCNRTGWGGKIFKNIWLSKSKLQHLQTENLNYTIDIN